MSSNNAPETEQIKPTVVRTLSPPPEIWELVHPVEERQSNSRGSFLRRYTPTAISIVLVVIVGALGAAIWTGDLRFRNVQKPTTSAKAQPLQVDTTPAPIEKTPAPIEKTPAPIETTPAPNDTTPAPSSAPQIASSVTQSTGVSVSDNSKRSTSHSIKRKTGIAAQVQQGAASSSQTTTPLRTQPARQTDQQSKVAPDSDKKNSADLGTAKPKSNANVNPVLSAPPKAASTPKAKVIQWP